MPVPVTDVYEMNLHSMAGAALVIKPGFKAGKVFGAEKRSRVSEW